jgi:dual specificity phosphatase 12
MLHINANDVPGQDIISHFDNTCAWIADAIDQGGNVLVHCLAGVSRSASVVIAYAMKKYGIDHSTALTLVSKARPIVSPNEGFLKQLQFYGALGCSLQGNTPAHAALQTVLHVDGSGRLDALLFLERWSTFRDL